jgi:hypothetical protein
LREDVDEISVLTLQPPSKGDALRWLAGQSWSPGQLDAVEAFLEPDSLALRPFFLKTLSDPSIAQQVSNTSATNILSILMDAMIEREITKFGEAVESELSKDQLRSYVREFMGEVARDMADNSTEAISDATLAWLVDVALPQNASDSTRRLLKARSQVLAFLTNDDRSGYRRFYHEKFFEYFLSIVLIDTVANGEISKPIARNILGSSFLETFGSVVSGGTATTKAAKFLEQALRIVSSVPPADRTSRNLSSLLLASLAVADLIEKFELSSVDIDEARFSGTAGVATLD